MKAKIQSGKTHLGIEFGSTRIKAVLTDDCFVPIASGSYEWENQLKNNYWTYLLDDIHQGIRCCFANLVKDVEQKYDMTLTTVGSMGISGMMHGYLAFDVNDNLLVPFRTWRNTTTGQASAQLTELFHFHIPQRWSIAHLYQAMLNKESHVSQIAHLTTLAGYIHFRLTGRRELGIGEASGMFPISGKNYDQDMMKKFHALAAQHGYRTDLGELLPEVKCAGSEGAYLTEEGARFLDPTGNFKAGVPLCPPEGDAGTGMVATNSVLPRTGNVSAGTSIFAMLTLEKPLDGCYPQIDLTTTPDGAPVAMVHCNNCCAELDSWVKIFEEFAQLNGTPADKSKLYEMLYRHALDGDADCGGITVYNYLSGEHITEINNGKPMYFRTPQSKMNLSNFMRAQLYASMATLKAGMDILLEKEQASAVQFQAHGGLFKVEGVAQQILANALNTAVSVMETAGEGGAWGMALLSAYMLEHNENSLGQWLSERVFTNRNTKTLVPDQNGVAGFAAYMKSYLAGLSAQKQLEGV